MNGSIIRSITELRQERPSGAALPPVKTGSAPKAAVRPITYAVGDIHGMDDLLSAMLAVIEADAASHGAPATVVFLGDAVNRGPQTRQVLDRLLAGPARSGHSWVVLRGNHEQIMLDAMSPSGTQDAAFRRWLKMGGRETLASYGGTRKDETPARASRLIDPRHLTFLAGLKLIHLDREYLFVHAGVEPRVPLDRQDADKLLTIRGPFLKRSHNLPYTVVHGHTPTDGAPMLGPGRIGVDTGAYFTGVLTAVAIGPDQSDRRFLRVDAGHRSRRV